MTLAVAIICIAMGCNGALTSGHIQAYMDVAPNFAGLKIVSKIGHLVNLFDFQVRSVDSKMDYVQRQDFCHL